jgi:hypothetical protein
MSHISTQSFTSRWFGYAALGAAAVIVTVLVAALVAQPAAAQGPAPTAQSKTVEQIMHEQAATETAQAFSGTPQTPREAPRPGMLPGGRPQNPLSPNVSSTGGEMALVIVAIAVLSALGTALAVLANANAPR